LLLSVETSLGDQEPEQPTQCVLGKTNKNPTSPDTITAGTATSLRVSAPIRPRKRASSRMSISWGSPTMVPAASRA
jgi:hypothetical protein